MSSMPSVTFFVALIVVSSNVVHGGMKCKVGFLAIVGETVTCNSNVHITVPHLLKKGNDYNRGCDFACCSESDDCNNESVQAIKNVVVCLTGDINKVRRVVTCAPGEYCIQKKTVGLGQPFTYGTGSCGKQSDDDALCNGFGCSASCNYADRCNGLWVTYMNHIVCLQHSTTVYYPCTTAGHICAKTETSLVATTSCRAPSECGKICGSTPGCTEACCYSYDVCNSASVFYMKNPTKLCLDGSGTSFVATICEAYQFCGRKEVTAKNGSVNVTASCQASVYTCEAQCGTDENCIYGCCSEELCNIRTVAEMGRAFTCMTGYVKRGVLTSKSACSTGELCGRKEIGTAISGTCVTQADCAYLCLDSPSCTSACCRSGDLCNNQTVAEMKSSIRCAAGSATDGKLPNLVICAANELCARTEITTEAGTTTVGSCRTQDACDLLCTGLTGCVSACCNNGDTCNTRSVAHMTNVLRCGTGTKVNSNLMSAMFDVHTVCPPCQLCARMEMLSGSNVETVGSCQTQAACDAGLCGGMTGCTAACCNSGDSCNALAVTRQGTIRCFVGTIRSQSRNPPPSSYSYQHCPSNTYLCSRTETTAANGDITMVGSCQEFAVVCDKLCGSTPNCIATCCNTDGCNASPVPITATAVAPTSTTITTAKTAWVTTTPTTTAGVTPTSTTTATHTTTTTTMPDQTSHGRAHRTAESNIIFMFGVMLFNCLLA